MSAIYGYPLDLPAGFEEETTYVYYLKDGGAAPAPAAAAGGMLDQIRRSGGVPSVGAPGAFRPNVVVTRTRTPAKLAAYVAEQRKAMLSAQGLKAAVREDRAQQVGGRPAQAAVIDLAIEELKTPLVQWQVLTARDGCIYGFFCTTTPPRWEKDRPRFEEFVAGWR